jgi:Ca-activated chloride channel homolog
MSFAYKNYLIYGVVAFLIFALFYWRRDKLFFKWVEDHWFYKQTGYARLSKIFYLFGFFFLSLI